MEFIGYALNLINQSNPGLYKKCGKTVLVENSKLKRSVKEEEKCK